MIAAGCVCFVGGVDDRFDLPPRLKLALQTVSVLPIILFGYYVNRVVAFGCPIQLGWLGIPLTVLWLLGCINAPNLLDGMDGLASLIGLSAAAVLGIIAASLKIIPRRRPGLGAGRRGESGRLSRPTTSPPASIFLGHSGSMW